MSINLYVQAQWRSYSTPVTLSGPEPFLHLTRRNTYPPYSSAMTMNHYDNNTVIFCHLVVCYTSPFTCIFIYGLFQYATMHNQGDDDGSSFTSISEVNIESSKVIRLNCKCVCIAA